VGFCLTGVMSGEGVKSRHRLTTVAAAAVAAVATDGVSIGLADASGTQTRRRPNGRPQRATQNNVSV